MSWFVPDTSSFHTLGALRAPCGEASASFGPKTSGLEKTWDFRLLLEVSTSCSTAVEVSTSCTHAHRRGLRVLLRRCCEGRLSAVAARSTNAENGAHPRRSWNWQRQCSEMVEDIGFLVGKVSPCHFDHKDWVVCGLVHGDDFVSVGSAKNLKTMSTHVAKKFMVKVTLAGPDTHEPLRVLNRAPGGRRREPRKKATIVTPTMFSWTSSSRSPRRCFHTGIARFEECTEEGGARREHAA